VHLGRDLGTEVGASSPVGRWFGWWTWAVDTNGWKIRYAVWIPTWRLHSGIRFYLIYGALHIHLSRRTSRELEEMCNAIIYL